MTVPGYVDFDDLVWKRRWFDSTSAPARTFNVGQCVVMVRDTSIAQPRNRNYSFFSHASYPPAIASIASLLGARHLWEVVENKPASSLVVSLGKVLNGRPRLYVEDR